MHRVEQFSNWGYWDRLDGRKLEEGERLRVRMPDGFELDTRVKVESSRQSIMDMGSPTTIEHSIAYGVVDFHGVEMRFPLRGLMAERLAG